MPAFLPFLMMPEPRPCAKASILINTRSNYYVRNLGSNTSVLAIQPAVAENIAGEAETAIGGGSMVYGLPVSVLTCLMDT